ncbi:MAG TPA: LPS export ABC transporter permease LptG [Sphingomonas sp.]
MIDLQFFPSRTLAFYMAKAFLVRTLSVLALLLIVMQTLDLLGESGNILAYPGNGNAQVLHYVALRLPQIVAFILPFSVLLGTLITLVTLNQGSEVIAMKAAGVSAHQILAPLVLASIGISIFAFAFNDRVVTHSTAALNAWEAVDYGPVPNARNGSTDIWVRQGDDMIHAAIVSGHGIGVRLTGVTVFDRDGGALKRIFTSAAAAPSLSPDGRTVTGWTSRNVTAFDVAAGRKSDMPRLDFGTDVSPDQFTLADVSADERSLLDLGGAINDLKAAGRPTGPLETSWWHKLSSPLSSVLMPLLAGVAAFGLARSGRLFVRAVIGMVLGFTYFVADNFALAMGNLGAYPPLLAAWSPFLLFLLIGETVLIRTEE